VAEGQSAHYTGKKGDSCFSPDQTLFLGRFSLLIHNYHLFSHIVQALPITSKVSLVFEPLKFVRAINHDKLWNCALHSFSGCRTIITHPWDNKIWDKGPRLYIYRGYMWCFHDNTVTAPAHRGAPGSKFTSLSHGGGIPQYSF